MFVKSRRLECFWFFCGRPAMLPRILVIQLKRVAPEYIDCINTSPILEDCRAELAALGIPVRLESGASFLVRGQYALDVLELLRSQELLLHTSNIICSEDMYHTVVEALRAIPARLRVRIKGWTPLHTGPNCWECSWPEVTGPCRHR